MARIRPYESQVSAQGDLPTRNAQPSDFGGAGLVNLGQAVESAGYQAGQAQRIVQANASRDAVTDVHTMLSGTRALYTQKSQEFISKADPSDTQLWDKFYAGGDANAPSDGSMKWYLDKYRESIQDQNAQQAFDRGAADLTSQFATHFVQQQARLSGVHAEQQGIKLINDAQTTVQTDPSQYSLVLADTLKAIHDPGSSFGRIDAGGRERIARLATEQIASSTVRGLINEDPRLAVHQLENGTWDSVLTGEQKIALQRSADTMVHALGVEQRQVEADRHRQQVELQHQTSQSLTAKYFLHMDNPGNAQYPAVTATEIAKAMQENRLDASEGRAIQNMMEADAKGGALKKDNEAYWKLFDRMSLPWGDPNKLTSTAAIYEAAAHRQLTSTAVKQLVEDFHKSRGEEGQTLVQQRKQFLEGQKASITHANPMLGKQDQEGDMLFANFSVYAAKQEALAMKENRDPAALYDPESEFYLGKKTAPYLKTFKDSIRSMANNLRRERADPNVQGETPSPSSARKPGESAADFLKRTQ